MNVPLATIDIGNSRVKVGVFETKPNTETLAEPFVVCRWTHGDSHGWPDVTPDRVVVGSVAPNQLRGLVASFPALWPKPTFVERSHLPVQIASAITQPDSVGIDRLANAAAARRLATDCTSIVVDAGTAITVDLINAHGEFCGGAILPGLQLAADSLTGRTELLPRIDMLDRTESGLPATNTIDAIRGGLRSSVSGGVAAVIARLMASTQTDCSQVVFCGGDGELLLSQCELAERFPSAELRPNLTLSGLALAACEK